MAKPKNTKGLIVAHVIVHDGLGRPRQEVGGERARHANPQPERILVEAGAASACPVPQPASPEPALPCTSLSEFRNRVVELLAADVDAGRLSQADLVNVGAQDIRRAYVQGRAAEDFVKEYAHVRRSLS